MAQWRVQLFGPLMVLREGEPVKLRIRQQGLLLAHLVSLGEGSATRSELAELLWPEADHTNALAYLRRALKELRDKGIELVAAEDRLRLDPDHVESDLGAMLRSIGERKLAFTESAVLEGIEHPIAEQIRRKVREELLTKAPVRSDASPEPVSRTEAGALMWIGETLVRTRPEVALELVSNEWDQILFHNSPEAALSLLLRILAANPEPSNDRLRVLTHAGTMAIVLTRFGLAEKLFLEALEGSEATDNLATGSHALSGLTVLMMESRQWERGLEYGRRSVEAAMQTGDPTRQFNVLNNMAGIQWHILRFDEAVENYRRAYEVAVSSPVEEKAHLICRANAAYLWAVFGTAVTPAVEPPVALPNEPQFASGFGGFVESYLQFSSGLGHRDLAATSGGAVRMLQIAAAENMERLMCIALDAAAFTFAALDRPAEAAACVRIGSRLRLQIAHRRSPAEALAVRRHVLPSPAHESLFGRPVTTLIREWYSDDLTKLATRVCAKLRAPRAL